MPHRRYRGLKVLTWYVNRGSSCLAREAGNKVTTVRARVGPILADGDSAHKCRGAAPILVNRLPRWGSFKMGGRRGSEIEAGDESFCRNDGQIDRMRVAVMRARY